MPDPFDALRSPVVPLAPDPGFAARLHARVAEALSRRPGAALGVTAYLIVTDARRAVDWYVEVLGARRRGDALVMPDGRVGHVEIELGADALFLADESPESPVAAPVPGAPATVTLVVEAPDVDVMVQRAANAGATVERAVAEHDYGRNAVVRDPFGHRWIISAAAVEPVGDTAVDAGDPDDAAPRRAAATSGARSGSGPAPMEPGDIGYVSLWVPDVARAQAFFGSVLGWRFAPGSSPRGRRVEGTAPHQGLWGEVERATLFVCYYVDDVDDAVARVRGAGGVADDPTDEPFGRVANCTDDQGTAFAVFRPPAGGPGPRLAPHGTRQGDLAYLTLEVVDSSRSRTFYGAVLGWEMRPGRVDDGWQVDGVRPGTGISGGHDGATAVPMYLVDDIGAAVARVRAAHGTATDPERQPYGVTSSCVDDQGTRFFLGEL